MILGGSRYAVPIIKKAHELNLYVISADYLPNNPAHRYVDKYININITEKNTVLQAALENQIDGIISFACDPGVISAAYVAEKIGLPFQCSYESACILQDKGKFRRFLQENGFNCPKAKRYVDKEAPLNDIGFFTWPVIVKPADSAGSKGITKIDKPEDLPNAIEKALKEAHNGAFIIEDFLTFEGYHSSADPFTVNGQLKFVTYSDQLFDTDAANPYTPSLIIWPSSMKEEHQKELTSEIQRLMNLLGMKTGIYNIETCIVEDKPYIMEVSPRGGGCRIAEVQKMAFGVDLIKAEIQKAVGMPIDEIKQINCEEQWCEMVIHARQNQIGVFKTITIDPQIATNYLINADITIRKGDNIRPFTGANMSFGDMIFRFNSREELNTVIGNEKEWLHIEIEN